MNNVFKWLIPWEHSVIVPACLLLAAILYWRGARRCPRIAPWPRQLAWWLGLAILYVGLFTHLDYYAQHEFFVHRLQHMGLHHMGPFLIVLANPGLVMRRGLSVRFRCHVLRPFLALPPVRMLFNFLLHPVVAPLLFFGLIYLWLYDPIHYIAMLDVRLYKVMNWSMTIDGLFFWWLVLDRKPKPPARLSPMLRVLLALVVIPPQIFIGAYITFVKHELYPIYDICGRAFLGISAMTDQYLGGLILWIPSSMMSVIAALVAFRIWVRLDARGRIRKRPRPVRPR